ncbi:two-component system VirA-like sensor kinase [Bradyrhizobium canariense]|uniref:histidine kinase n=1 Tax=Bradyrhizobium canariense TaxID=255045 RepID=A0A1H2BI58_9BRAD|nr:two-component system VirA-like sensor kinase [Bradyrhizobium canariense]SDT57476.1 His Kinase A (phospho-acceptor) domain-containing protein [Bradyrhizobium canariense]
MSTLKATPVAVIVLFFLLLLTWLLLSGLNLNSVRYDRELRALDDFSRFERALNREVLTARVGLSRNYDALARIADAYDNSLDRLREAAGPKSEESAAIEVLATVAHRQQDLVERFKSRNALLQNSLTYFGIFSARLAASNDKPVVAATSALAAAMLHLTLDTSQVAVDEVQQRLNELAALQSPRDDAESIQAAVAHGGILRDLLPATDAVLKALIATASNPEQTAVRSLIVKRQLAARASARRYRLFLYVTSVMLLGALAYLGLQLRARAIALRRRAGFEHVIARISTRFINSQQHEIATDVKWALQELAECLGADRAYFIVAAEPIKVYRWFRGRAEFPQGWPERALNIASRLEHGDDNIVHIPVVRPSHSYDTINLLADAGLQGWLCILSPGGQRTRAILGFDALRAGTLAQWAEFSLFRMAFDAIANAVGRVALEQEKERLEVNLQQARRLETLGAFASGIAHNFNNIVGAILGYAEMADTQVSAGSRSASNLAEIRHAGERARELVDQILTFGNRGDARRERICINALVAETRSLLTASLPSHVELMVRETPERAIVSAEPAQLQQVILNVCNNAAQAMDQPGIVEIRIEVREMAHTLKVGGDDVGPGRFAVVSISDSGRGMDKATLKRIFDPFFTTRIEGNGLGLATAREIVHEHDGAIGVQSAVGAGTRFDIWLPCAPPNELESTRHASGMVGRGIGETVLVFETDPVRLLRHEEVLAALGYEPVGFTKLADAMAACRAIPLRFDAALVCHQPGNASALDFAAALHDALPALPIILATPSARDLGAPLLVGSGISEVVHHPLMSAELVGALSRCLADSAALQGAKAAQTADQGC